jgi:hypothetical protein
VVTDCCMRYLVCAAFGMVALEYFGMNGRSGGVKWIKRGMVCIDLGFNLDPLFLRNFG